METVLSQKTLAPNQAKRKILNTKENSFKKFLNQIDKKFLQHSIVTDNLYTQWFQEGQATLEDLIDLTVQFSVFSNYFLVAQLKKMINAQSLESMRLAKEILANEIGVVFRDPNQKKAKDSDDLSLLGVSGTIDGSTFHFRAAHFEWLVDFGKCLGLDFQDLGRWNLGTAETHFFCNKLEQLYGSSDPHISSGAGFAIENWAAAGFWQELEDGLRKIKTKSLPEMPLNFWAWHNRLEAQHAAHTHDELETLYQEDDFDEKKFLDGGCEMLNGLEAFWKGLNESRLLRKHKNL